MGPQMRVGDENTIKRVYGVAQFESVLDAPAWTEDEISPIETAMFAINESVRRTCGVRDAQGLGRCWVFQKRPVVPVFYTRMDGWTAGAWHDDTPDAVAAKLMDYYSGYLEHHSDLLGAATTALVERSMRYGVVGGR
jgi:hypothetical protein